MIYRLGKYSHSHCALPIVAKLDDWETDLPAVRLRPPDNGE
jgi:hypothetical protein